MARDYITDPKGHVWKTLQNSDEIDIFAYDEGFHNGPGCIKCGFSFCHHCSVVIRECPGPRPADPSPTNRHGRRKERVMIKVTSDVPVYERNGEDSNWQVERIEVRSHWNIRGRIVIQIGEESYTVLASDLEAAIKNAVNANR